MFAFDPSQKMMGHVPVPAAAQPTSTASTDGESVFHRLLDIVNPLQHLPVVGTIYRAATGEHIGPIEKIAGDGLYGGIWGAVTAAADVAFEQITGKSVEDTMLAWVKGGGGRDDRIQVAKLQAPAIIAQGALPSGETPSLPMDVAANDTLDVSAFTGAVSAKGIDGEIAARALFAYRRAMIPAQTPVVAALN